MLFEVQRKVQIEMYLKVLRLVYRALQHIVWIRLL